MAVLGLRAGDFWGCKMESVDGSDRQGEHIRSRARELRKTMSLPEVLLWQALRPKFNDRFRLRRQKPVLDRYVLDFYFAPLKVAFEIDGRWAHEDRFERDEKRDRDLAAAGISVVHITAKSVLEDVHEVSNLIRSICLGEVLLTDLDPTIVTLAE